MMKPLPERKLSSNIAIVVIGFKLSVRYIHLEFIGGEIKTYQVKSGKMYVTVYSQDNK